MTQAPLQEPGFQPRIGVLTNPLSGSNRRNPEVLSSVIRTHPEILLQHVQSPEDVHRALAEFASKEVNILVINGGDGTVQAALTDLFNHSPFVKIPLMVVLAGGTTNMIAGDVGIIGNKDQILQRLLQKMLTDQDKVTRTQRSILSLTVPGHETKYGMFFGAASISQATQYYHNNLHSHGLRGFPAICITILRFLWAIIWQRNRFVTPTPVEVRLNNQPPVKDNFMLLFVSTLDRFIFGLHPFWGTEKGPLRFTAIKSRTRYLSRVLPFLARGRRVQKGTPENGYLSHNVDEIALYLMGSVVLDGELYTPETNEQPTILQHGGDVTFLQI